MEKIIIWLFLITHAIHGVPPLWGVFVAVYGKIDDISSPKEGLELVLSIGLKINMFK